MSSRERALGKVAATVPPVSWFGVSAVFHYLGPSFAVLLFPAVGILGVVWMRIASAAAILALWTRPWRTLRGADRQTRLLLIALGACLAMMNTAFYFALDRLPMSLVAAIEFVGTIGLALYGLRTGRNLLALGLAVAGAFLLIDVKLSSNLAGLCWALLNAALFVGYIVLGHKVSERGASEGVEHLAAAMAIAFLIVTPIGLPQAVASLGSLHLVLAGIGVGLCSSVIPYVCDQLAMSRLPRSSFALLLALLPATATIIGVVVLAQIPSAKGALGVLFVMIGIALHKPAPPVAADGTPATAPGPKIGLSPTLGHGRTGAPVTSGGRRIADERRCDGICEAR